MVRVGEISSSDIVEYARRRKEPEWLIRRRLEALEALQKLPPDPLVDEYVKELDLDAIFSEEPIIEVPREYWDIAVKRLGIRPEELQAVAGLAVTLNNRVVEAHLKMLREKGVVLMPMDEAVRKVELVREYMFRVMRPDTRLAAYHIAFWAGGIFLYVPRGVKIPSPLYAVFLITRESFKQTEHSLIVLDEESSVTWVEGCTAPVRAAYSVHLGGLEAYVHKGARLTVHSVQNWVGPVHHRPVKRFVIEENGVLTATPISLGGATIVIEERAELRGGGASATIQGVSLLDKDKWAESRLEIVHDAPASRSELLSRAVVKDRARDRFVGRLVATRNARGSVGRMACNTLLLSEEASAEAVPSIHADLSDVEFSHEASVGRLSREKLLYLRSMGFSEEEASSILVQGFFEPVFMGLPFDLAVEVRKIVEMSLKAH